MNAVATSRRSASWSPTSPVLAGHHLSHAYGSTTVLDDVDFTVRAGEVVAIMGPSGSGKSTLLHLLAGLLRPDGGRVDLEGERIDNLSERRRSDVRLRHLGFVFQFGDLVPELTLRENAELPLRLLGTKPGAARRRALDLLDRLGVAEVADRRVSEVSGGGPSARPSPVRWCTLPPWCSRTSRPGRSTP